MCDTKRKIAFVLDRYRKGGVSVVLEVLLQQLVKENIYDITLFVRDYDKDTMRAVPEGVMCLPWEEYQSVSGAWTSGGFAEVCSLLHNKLRSAWNVRNAYRKTVYKARCRKQFSGKYDCVIAYHMIPNDVATVALEKIEADRKLLWLHFRKNISEKDKAFYYSLYSGADGIVCVSEDTARQFLLSLPECAGKTRAIHNLYDIERIQSRAAEVPQEMDTNPGPVRLVTAARLAREKGFDRVPAVARKLADDGYDFQWYIVGDGNRKDEIQQDIQEKNVSDRVHLLGHRSNPYPYIKNCDIYVQTSYMEGFCTSTMEAKILFKPVVTTEVPGMREQFVSGENGLIVESSVDGIYNGIKQLLDNPELMETIIRNLHAEPITNEEALRQTMDVINGV